MALPEIYLFAVRAGEVELPFTSEAAGIEDVRVIRPQRLHDERGMFVEVYSRRSLAALGIDVDFVQDNEALSMQAGTLRGLHFQVAPDPQAKLIHVVAGAIFDAVVDLRDGSPTFGRWCGTSLTATGGEMLFVPAGFAHGYCTLEPDTLVAYKAGGYYNRSAERGLRWDDPDIGIGWPLPAEQIIVSDKDAGLPFLRDLPKPFRFHD